MKYTGGQAAPVIHTEEAKSRTKGGSPGTAKTRRQSAVSPYPVFGVFFGYPRPAIGKACDAVYVLSSGFLLISQLSVTELLCENFLTPRGINTNFGFEKKLMDAKGKKISKLIGLFIKNIINANQLIFFTMIFFIN